MREYYYFIGHDWNEGRMPNEYFWGYDSIYELANMHYDGDIKKALADSEYVFSAEEYESWINQKAEEMIPVLAIQCESVIEKQMDEVGFIDDSDNVDRFLDTLARKQVEKFDEFEYDVDDLAEKILQEIKDRIMTAYKQIGECDEKANYRGVYYKADREFKSLREFNEYFELEDFEDDEENEWWE